MINMIYFDYKKHFKRQNKKNTLEMLEKLAFNIVDYLYFSQWNVSGNSVKYIMERVKGTICQKDTILFIYLMNEIKILAISILFIVFKVLSKVFNEFRF